MGLKSIKDLYQYLEDQFGSDKFGYSYGYAQGQAIAKNIEEEIADNYIRLPVDADGVLIDLGDKLIEHEDGHEFIVDGVKIWGSTYEWWAYEDGGILAPAKLCTHVKPRTLEDVLREYGKAYHAHMADNYMNYDGTDEQVIDKYADEIRELLGGDAE